MAYNPHIRFHEQKKIIISEETSNKLFPTTNITHIMGKQSNWNNHSIDPAHTDDFNALALRNTQTEDLGHKAIPASPVTIGFLTLEQKAKLRAQNIYGL